MEMVGVATKRQGNLALSKSNTVAVAGLGLWLQFQRGAGAPNAEATSRDAPFGTVYLVWCYLSHSEPFAGGLACLVSINPQCRIWSLLRISRSRMYAKLKQTAQMVAR